MANVRRAVVQTVAQIGSVSRSTLLLVFWTAALGVVFLLAIGPPELQLGSGPNDWARALGSPRNEVRRAATERLLVAGARSVEPLERVAVERGHIARSERCVDVLRKLYQSPDPQVYRPADAALLRLTRCENMRVRGYISTTNSRSDGLRLSRCAIAFEEFGGEMRIDPRQFEVATLERPPEAFTAIVGAEWRGADEGLVHLHRMPQLRVVHVFEDARVSREAVERLRRERPELAVIYRNEGCLGMAGVSPRTHSGRTHSGATYFEVLSIEPQSGAARVGLRPHDRIVRFGGQEVTSFEMIAERLLDYSPGELLPMVIDRGGERIAIDVPVGRLQGEDCVCLEAAADEPSGK